VALLTEWGGGRWRHCREQPSEQRQVAGGGRSFARTCVAYGTSATGGAYVVSMCMFMGRHSAVSRRQQCVAQALVLSWLLSYDLLYTHVSARCMIAHVAPAMLWRVLAYALHAPCLTRAYMYGSWEMHGSGVLRLHNTTQ